MIFVWIVMYTFLYWHANTCAKERILYICTVDVVARHVRRSILLDSILAREMGKDYVLCGDC